MDVSLFVCFQFLCVWLISAVNVGGLNCITGMEEKRADSGVWELGFRERVTNHSVFRVC